MPRLPTPADWDASSGFYDRQLRLERRAIAVALGLAAVTADDRLVDVGTGTGAVLRRLARAPGRPRRAVGVDASRAMLARVPPLPAGWETVRADAAALPFAAASFDVAVAAYLLHVLGPAERRAALAELRRVLAPGGRLVTVTPIVPRGAPATCLWALAGALARVAPARCGGLRALDPRDDLAHAGFRLVRGRATGRGYPSLALLARAEP